MPDRVIRQAILNSDSVNKLSWPGEVFYRRLMSIVDDYGRHDARPSILRANLYPLHLDKVSEPDIVKWKMETSKAGLVRFYDVEGKEYLEVLKFGQRLRAMKSKCPPPTDNDDAGRQMTSNDVNGLLKRDGNESESETETESETEGKPPPLVFWMELKRDAIFYEKVAMAWNVNEQGYSKMISDFEAFLSSKGKSHPSYPEYKSHFFNWGAKMKDDYKRAQKQMVD